MEFESEQSVPCTFAVSFKETGPIVRFYCLVPFVCLKLSTKLYILFSKKYPDCGNKQEATKTKHKKCSIEVEDFS